MSYVIETGSNQYIVDEGQEIIVDQLGAAEGDSIDLEVIYTFGGTPSVATVKATVVRHQRGEKIRVVKYKAKSNYHRQYGYRHSETVLLIGAAPAAKKPTAKKATATSKAATPAKEADSDESKAKKAAAPKKAAAKKPVTKKTTVKKAEKKD